VSPAPQRTEFAQVLGQARRLVVKLGTAVVTRDGFELALGRLYGIVEELGRLHRDGASIMLVTSGAVGMGTRVLGLSSRPTSLGLRQACAAVGMGHLMALYTQAFAQMGVTAAQVLLTQDDLADRDRALCLRTTLLRLLELRALPILNENDSVSVRELVEHLRQPGDEAQPAFGDNDGLSARVAVALDADLLVLMTNVDGLYTANPTVDPHATRIPASVGVPAELDALAARGVDVSKLRISANAHVITHYHRTLDKVTERFLGKRQIGTTGRGIGPTYADKINRVGIRMQDLFDENILRQKVEGALDQKNHLLVKVYNRRAITVDEIVDELLSYAERLRPMVVDTALELHEALERGETVLFEGGQATMLDVDHGTYPFVTSSNATSGGAATGSGIAPNRIDRVIGIVKAYTTRVGSGPFPTELFDESGEFLRANGHEYGTTTGRPRRCGWYDAPIARYSARINGVTDYVMTKLDVLTGLERIPVCVAYDVDGVRFDELPVSQSDFHHATPIYEELPGWSEDISGARTFDDLPKTAQQYVLAIEAMSGARISAIGVGPGRDAIVVRHDLLD